MDDPMNYSLGQQPRPDYKVFRMREQVASLRAQLAAVKRQRDELIRAKTGKSPDDLFCCNGLECGCQGVTVGEYELYCVDRAIKAASQPAQQPKPEAHG